MRELLQRFVSRIAATEARVVTLAFSSDSWPVDYELLAPDTPAHVRDDLQQWPTRLCLSNRDGIRHTREKWVRLEVCDSSSETMLAELLPLCWAHGLKCRLNVMLLSSGSPCLDAFVFDRN